MKMAKSGGESRSSDGIRLFLEVDVEDGKDATFDVDRPERITFQGDHIGDGAIVVLEGDGLGQRFFELCGFRTCEWLEPRKWLELQWAGRNGALVDTSKGGRLDLRKIGNL